MAVELENGHLLFLPEEPGEEMISPACITVDRLGPVKENGGKVWEPDEIPDEDALRQMFGPGTYQIRARNAKRHVIRGRRIVIRGGGVPLSMDGSRLPIDGYLPPTASVAAPAKEVAGVAGNGSGELSMLLAFMREMSNASAMQLQAIVATERERSQAMVTTVVELAKSQNERVAAVAAAPSAAPVNSENMLEVFQQGLAFANEMRNSLEEAKAAVVANGGGDGSELEKTVLQLLGGWMATKGIGPGGAPPGTEGGSPP